MSSYAFEGVPGATTRQASTDTAATISAALLVAADGTLAKGVLFQADTNTIRIAFGGATPVAGAGGLGHTLAAADTFYVKGYTAAKKMKLVSAATGVHGGINITPEF
jgi:hypothetical protein